jgi:2,5-diamino-6-(ribosylamino)-4(3H)-pyrimidinone 5'-phosphate reductase
MEARLLPADEQNSSPQPIVLDSGLRFRSDSKLLSNWIAGTGRQPVIFTKVSNDDSSHIERVSFLEKCGAIIKQVPNENGIDR